MAELFTPYVEAGSQLRAYMRIPSASMRAFDDLPRDSEESVEVWDEVSQASYKVKRSSCGGCCRCAAVIVKE